MGHVLNIWNEELQKYVGIPAIQGPPGVYYGTSKPTDLTHPLWINPDGEDVGDLDMMQDKITNLADPVDPKDAVTKDYSDRRPNPNLLDNWHFPNPVNQRGVSGTVSAAGYFIDRWKLESGSVQITDAGLVLNGTMIQILEFPVGQTTTATVLTSSGLVSGNYDDTEKTFTITATGQTIIAAKLELGNTQTLAHEENGGLLLNEIPDHDTEFLKCLRYFRLFEARIRYLPGNTATTVYPIYLDIPFRTTPVIVSRIGESLATFVPSSNRYIELHIKIASSGDGLVGAKLSADL